MADHAVERRQHIVAGVSLNGEYQSLTYTALYLSGAPFALWNASSRSMRLEV
jgi:hypothetical protein